MDGWSDTLIPPLASCYSLFATCYLLLANYLLPYLLRYSSNSLCSSRPFGLTQVLPLDSVFLLSKMSG